MRILLASTILAGGALLAAPAANAGTIIVGTCQNGTHVATIQAAVNASAPGGIVSICPGTYAEQVIVTQKLTLVGLSNSNSSQALIVPPAGGLVANTTYLGTDYPVAAQVLVQNANVTLNNLTVDGTGNGVSGCLPDVVGVMYQNASGTIKSSTVRNQFLSPYDSLGGCQSGQAIWTESSGGAANVKITGNNVLAFQKNGISGNGPGLNVTISSNTLYGLGSTSGAAENGVQISSGTTGSVSKNRVGDEIWAPDQVGDTGDAASGILVYDSPGITIQGNGVSSTQYGIVIYSDGSVSSDGAQITGNSVGRTYLYDAVDVCGAGGAKITGNNLQGSDEAGVHLDSTCSTPSTGNTVTGNTITGACTGILVGSGSSGTTSPNTITSSASLITNGSDTCGAQPGRHSKKSHRPAPVRH
jgi:parallel beta-helix repeat protein